MSHSITSWELGAKAGAGMRGAGDLCSVPGEMEIGLRPERVTETMTTPVRNAVLEILSA